MARVAFFISYTGDDRAWAEWIAWQLEAAGSTTVLQAWDFRPGGDFVQRMHQAVGEAERTIAVLSPSYLESAFGAAEWRAVFAKDPSGEHGLLLPVRVQECEPPGLLASRIYLELVGLDESAAKDAREVGTWPECAQLLSHALAASESAEQLDVEPERIAELLNGVGIRLGQRAQFTAARSAFERALKADEAVCGPEHPTVAIRANNLGSVLHELGDLAGARVCWERALAIYTTTYGTGYPRARQVEQALEQLDSDRL